MYIYTVITLIHSHILLLSILFILKHTLILTTHNVSALQWYCYHTAHRCTYVYMVHTEYPYLFSFSYTAYTLFLLLL